MDNWYNIGYNHSYATAGNQVVLQPTSTAPQRLVCVGNIDNGLGFMEVVTESINVSASGQGRHVAAWNHGTASKGYPCNVSIDFEGVGVDCITRYWTRTDSHDGGFYWSREFYGSRNSKKRRLDQAVAFSMYLRDTQHVGFLIASLETATGRYAHLVPWPAVKDQIKASVKLDLPFIGSWPRFKQCADGTFEIDLSLLEEMIIDFGTGSDPVGEPSGRRWW